MNWTPRFFAGAPTRDQAKRIFWDDLKALSPRDVLSGAPSESDLTLRYINGAQITVVGMDRPERIEGSPWDGGVLDEYGNMKGNAWPENVRPALSDRLGWCDLIGVPEGRNHYYDLAVMAKKYMVEYGTASEWGYFHWKSAAILDPREIASAREHLDELTFQQEYEGSFVNFVGRAYYPFDHEIHLCKLEYDPRAPLILCFDFNVDPGVAVIVQEQLMPGQTDADGEPLLGTGVIGEVHIPRNSNTPAVCRKILDMYAGAHEGRVICYGDATGGARGTAKVSGSDWDLIKTEFRGNWLQQPEYRVPAANPKERARINAMNSRLMSTDLRVRLLVDPVRAPYTVKDLDGVRLLEGGSGEIDKKSDPNLSHLSDALGYYVVNEFPVGGKPRMTMRDMY